MCNAAQCASHLLHTISRGSSDRDEHTIDGGEQDSGVIVGDDVCVSVLWFVDLQVGVLPRELLTGIDRLRRKRNMD